MDNVKCSNCGFNGLVETGTDKCPNCGYEGGLAWKENEPQELEEGEDMIVAKIPMNVLKRVGDWVAIRYVDLDGYDLFIYNVTDEEMYMYYVTTEDEQFLEDWKNLTGEDYGV